MNTAPSAAGKRWALAAIVVAVLGVLGYLLLGPVLEPEHVSVTAHDDVGQHDTSSRVDHSVAHAPAADSAPVREAVAKEHAVTWNVRVLDKATHEPVARAHVELRSGAWHVEADCGDDGVLGLEAEEHPSVDLIVEHPSYVPAHVPGANASQQQEVLLERAGELRVVLRPAPTMPAIVSLFEQVSDDEKHWPSRRLDARELARFTQLAPGDYTLTARAEGWVSPTMRGLRMRGGESRDVILDLAPESRLRGRLLLADAESPVAGARVMLSSTDPTMRAVDSAPPAIATTELDGRFEFGGLTCARYKLLFQPRDGLPFSAFFVVSRSGSQLDQDFHTPSSLHVHGRAVDADTHPIPNATIALFSPTEWVDALEHGAQRLNMAERPTARSRVDGSFDLNARCQLNAMVFLMLAMPGKSLDAVSSTWRIVDVARDQADQDVGDVTVNPSRAIHGHVKDEGGSSVPGAKVEVSAQYPDMVLFEAACADDGSFSIDVCTRGNSRRELARRFGGAPGDVGDGVVLQSKLVDPIELILRRARTVSGRVVDTDGRGVSNIEVMLGTQLKEHKRGPKPGGGDASAITDENGRFKFADVVAMESELGLAHSVMGEWRMERREPTTIPGDGDQQATMVVSRNAIEERAILRGRLVLPAGLEALSATQLGARVRRPEGSGLDPTMVPGDEGTAQWDGNSFTLYGVRPGHLLFTCSSRECATVSRTIDVSPGETLDLGDIELVRSAQLVVRIVDASGKRVTDAIVQLRPVDPLAPALGWSHAQYSFTGLVWGGKYDLYVRRNGHEDHVERIEVPTQAVFELEVHVE